MKCICHYFERLKNRGSERDVVYLGQPIALSYMSPNAGGAAGSQPMSAAVHMEHK